MSKDAKREKMELVVERLGVGRYEKHLILCAGDSCCDAKTGAQLWKYTKARLGELGLTNGRVFRTKASCLRICREGPIAVVYPEGTWYRRLDEEKMERIIQEHLLDGQPVEAFQFASNPLA